VTKERESLDTGKLAEVQNVLTAQAVLQTELRRDPAVRNALPDHAGQLHADRLHRRQAGRPCAGWIAERGGVPHRPGPCIRWLASRWCWSDFSDWVRRSRKTNSATSAT
jgi:hypothetical protein